MVLLVVDTQKAVMNNSLFAYDKLVENIKLLIGKARKIKMEVIYVQHDDGPESDLERGTESFEVFDAFKPMPGEKIFMKTVNSPFRDTDLAAYLQKKNEKDIIVVGLQTDKCINATIICGFEHGFHMIVPAYTNSTVDNTFMSAEKSYHYFNDFMWQGRYAECLPVEETIARMKNTDER